MADGQPRQEPHKHMPMAYSAVVCYIDLYTSHMRVVATGTLGIGEEAGVLA